MKHGSRDAFEVFAPVEPGAQAQGCAWPGCDGAGAHRAPVSRHRLDQYVWFCLEHVRIYNSSWNYYVGMSEAEVEANVRADTTWNRPTWPLGTGPWLGDGRGAEADPFRFAAFSDPFGFLRGSAAEAKQPQPPSLPEPARRSLDVLDLDFPVTFEEVRARYKALVKLHHPDANGGDKGAEERLKRINEAYETLKTGLFA